MNKSYYVQHIPKSGFVKQPTWFYMVLLALKDDQNGLCDVFATVSFNE